MDESNPAIKELFFTVLDKQSPQELVAYVDEACSEDPVLRSRVEHLLRAHQHAGNFLGGADAFVLALQSAAAYENLYGAPPSTNGDTDGDGDLDFDDIAGFLKLI